MCVKTTAPVAAGDEILVDYGSKYFEHEPSDPDGDSDSASDYEREKRRRSGGGGSGKRRSRQSGGASSLKRLRLGQI